jgi:fused signal recognition particle receptor
MFEGLRKKFSNFIGGIAKKEAEEAAQAEKEEKAEEESWQAAEAKKEEKPKQASAGEAAKEERREVEQAGQKGDEEGAKDPQAQKTEQDRKAPEVKSIRAVIPTPGHGVATATTLHGARQAAGEPLRPKNQEPQRASQTMQPNATFTTRLKGVIFRQVKISEKDADPFIDALKIGLLQSDVNYDVAEKMAASIRISLVGKQVNSKDIQGDITKAIRSSIMNVLSSRPEVDIVKMISMKKEAGGLPFKIMFIGPNGAGKTTTMAKVANLLLSSSITCVLSASDTFRAAAIEQTVFHGSKLGVNVIKGNYGSDPSSIAFDAIAHAKAHGIMAVLIDSAGRQETNRSLIEELKKMARVTAPDLKIFVGEAISGNALLEQVKAIDQAIKLDGIILTKLDVDAKGGNTISILSDTSVPILFFGTGEKYADMIPYDPAFVADSIIPNN